MKLFKLLALSVVSLSIATAQTPLRIGILPTPVAPPYTGIDEATSAAFGFDTCLWNALAEESGITITFVKIASFQGLFDALRSGAIDATGCSIAAITPARLDEFESVTVRQLNKTTQAFIINPLNVPIDLFDPEQALHFVLHNAHDKHPVRVGAFFPSVEFDSLVQYGYPAQAISKLTAGGSAQVAAGFCDGSWDIFFTDASLSEKMETSCGSLQLLDGIPLPESQHILGAGYFFKKGFSQELLDKLQDSMQTLVTQGVYQQCAAQTVQDTRFAQEDRDSFAVELARPSATVLRSPSRVPLSSRNPQSFITKMVHAQQKARREPQQTPLPILPPELDGDTEPTPPELVEDITTERVIKPLPTGVSGKPTPQAKISPSAKPSTFLTHPPIRARNATKRNQAAFRPMGTHNPIRRAPVLRKHKVRKKVKIAPPEPPLFPMKRPQNENEAPVATFLIPRVSRPEASKSNAAPLKMAPQTPPVAALSTSVRPQMPPASEDRSSKIAQKAKLMYAQAKKTAFIKAARQDPFLGGGDITRGSNELGD